MQQRQQASRTTERWSMAPEEAAAPAVATASCSRAVTHPVRLTRMGGGAAKRGSVALRHPPHSVPQPAVPELLVRQGAACEEEQRDPG